MASEILDVVTRINYDVDNKGIDASTQAIEKNIDAATNAQSRLTKLQAALNSTGEQDVKRRERLAGLIGKQIKLMEQLGKATANQIATDRKLQASLTQSQAKFNSISYSLGNLIRDAPSFAFGLRQGFLAIGNNIGVAFDDIIRRIAQLRAEGKSASLIFKDIGGALFGLSGLLWNVISYVLNGLLLART